MLPWVVGYIAIGAVASGIASQTDSEEYNASEGPLFIMLVTFFWPYCVLLKFGKLIAEAFQLAIGGH